MTITFLDAVSTNKNDLDWSMFSDLGELKIFDLTMHEQVADRIQNTEIIVTNKVKILREHMKNSPKLKLICVLATGYEIIDLDAASEFGITVCNVPSYSTESVVQTTFALLLELTHRLGEHDHAVHAGEWTKSPTFSFWRHPIIELSGKTFVVVGYGTIGKRVAEVACAFGMNVVITSLQSSKHNSPFPELPLDEAINNADVISLHIPLTKNSKEIVNQDWLKKMKPSSSMINTARGALINEEDLSYALKNKLIAGYAADVLSSEPPSQDNPLLSAPNCILSPHLAWASLESRKRLWQTCSENIRAFLFGTPQNLV